MRLFRKVGLEAATALLQGEVQFRHDVVDGGDRFLRFGGEWDLRRADMDKDHRRPARYTLPSPLLRLISPPINVGTCLSRSLPSRRHSKAPAVRASRSPVCLAAGHL